MHKVLFYIAAFLLVPVLFSCTSDENITPPDPEEKGELVTVYFNSTAPETYSLDFEKESKVDIIDIIAFKIEGNSMKYAYRKEVSNDKIQPAEFDEIAKIYKRKFEVELLKDGSQYFYVFFANARQAIIDCLDKYPNIVEKDYLLSHLIVSNTGVWETNNNFKYFPMWGEFGPATPNTLNNKTIDLTRAVARVDVTVSADFTLEEVYVKNQYNYGRIVPDPANWDNTKKEVTEPTFPFASDYTGSPTNGNALLYSVISEGNSSIRDIYLLETKKPSNNDYVNATHLIIKGKRAGGSSTYYRIDFRNAFSSIPEDNNNSWEDGPPTSGSGSGGFVGAGEGYGNLLRNHHYQLNIISVDQDGYTTVDEAAANTSSRRIISEYISWQNLQNNVNIGSTSYSFDISRVKVSLYRDFTSDFIVVKTNYPGEWVIDKPASYDWFSCQKKDNGVSITFEGDMSTAYSGSFDILLKNGDEVKYTKKIQVEYSNK